MGDGEPLIWFNMRRANKTFLNSSLLNNTILTRPNYGQSLINNDIN